MSNRAQSEKTVWFNLFAQYEYFYRDACEVNGNEYSRLDSETSKRRSQAQIQKFIN